MLIRGYNVESRNTIAVVLSCERNKSVGKVGNFLLTHQRQRAQAGSVREYVFFVFFHISKNMTFYVFFEMTYQKVVKSHQQKFSPRYVTKE